MRLNKRLRFNGHNIAFTLSSIVDCIVTTGLFLCALCPTESLTIRHPVHDGFEFWIKLRRKENSPGTNVLIFGATPLILRSTTFILRSLIQVNSEVNMFL